MYQTTSTNYNTLNRSDRSLPPPIQEPSVNKTNIFKRETTETSTNAYPADYPPYPPPKTGPNQTTYVYKHDVTNRDTNVYQPSPVYPNDSYPPAHQPGHAPPPKQTYIYKYETTNTNNTQYGPPSNRTPSTERVMPINTHPHQGYPPSNGGPPQSVTYNYTTINRTNTSTHGYPGGDHHQPLLAPPFPTDTVDHQHYVDGQPPKRLDDLLASFDDVSTLRL